MTDSRLQNELDNLNAIIRGEKQPRDDGLPDLLNLVKVFDQNFKSTESSASILNNAVTSLNLKLAHEEEVAISPRAELMRLLVKTLEGYVKFRAVASDVRCVRPDGTPDKRQPNEAKEVVEGSYMVVISGLVGLLVSQETNNPAQGGRQG